MSRNDILEDIQLTVAELTEAVGSLVREANIEMNFLNRAQSDNRRNHSDRSKVVNKHIRELEELDKLNKSAGKRCSCGEPHKILRFKEGSMTVKEMCPKLWYRKLCRLTFERGESLTALEQEVPLSVFMRNYNL